MIRCTICTNQRISHIDALIVKGRSLLSVANEVGLSYPAVRRHVRSGHVAALNPWSPANAERVAKPAPIYAHGVVMPEGQAYQFSAEEDASWGAAVDEFIAYLAATTGSTRRRSGRARQAAPIRKGCAPRVKQSGARRMCSKR